MTIVVQHHQEIKLYKRRWFLMVLFMWYTVVSGLHWVELSSISKIVSNYYKVPQTWTQWTTMISSGAIVIFLFPFLQLLNKIGMRYFMILANLIHFIGAAIKTLSVNSDRFYVLILGQCFTATTIVFTYCMVSCFTAAWFSNKEISRAGALILIGDQVGTALSFLLPNVLVKDNSNLSEIEEGMITMHLSYASAAFFTLGVVVIFFKDEPKCPPSMAQALRRNGDLDNVWESLKKIFCNLSFWSISISYGLVVSTCQVISTFLNEFVSINFPDRLDETGNLGFMFMISGMVGSLIFGYVADRTRKFKENAILLTFGSFISLGLMSIALKSDSIIYFYVIITFMGTFIMAFYATGIQMGIEATYPVPENIVTAVMLLCVQIISLCSTVIFGVAMKMYGDVKCIVALSVTLLLSSVLACLFPSHLRREQTEKTDKARMVEMEAFLAHNKKKPIVINCS